MDITGVGAVSDLVKDIVNKIWPDKTEAERGQLAMAMTIVQGQIDTNKIEAGSEGILKGGWRPMIGWVCGCSCAWNWIGLSICKTVAVFLSKPEVAAQLVPANISEMLPILVSMLGLGMYRSVEKVKGVN